mmetsp:Transcript_60071/g.147724  ORF Transcript_60071/g.147724 Transcript_60071/m.147724 type:complete len:1831 (+) Transcript_60071:228-5720(+)
MVSRTPRHQSQPRPTNSGGGAGGAGSSRNPQQQFSSSRPASSFDLSGAGGGGRGGGRGGHASHQYDQRRAQSSMRYQSSGRDSSRMKGRDSLNLPGLQSEKQHRMSYGNALAPAGGSGGGGGGGAARPRAISAGKLRAGSSQQQHKSRSDPHDDPSAIAKQILDLRERRESSQSTASVLQRAKSVGSSRPRSTTPHNKASPGGLVLKTADSGLSQEEIQAEHRLQKAEGKINGLLQELEELKFFQEIEDEQPAPPTTPRTPRTPSRTNSVNAKAAGPPTTIRAASPSRGARLPPPPPANTLTKGNVGVGTSKPNNNSSGGGGLETYKPLSPRTITKLDRNSLELECQTLVRKMQILEQDKSSHEATIEMYEVSLREHNADKAKVQKLEGELRKVSSELKKQLQNIQKGKETLVREYEEKLQNNIKKLHRTQEKADSYQAELQTYQTDMEKFANELQKHRDIAANERSRADEMTAAVETTQLQLEEARNLNATLVKKVEKKRSEVTNLKEDLTNTNKMMEETARDREEEYETRIHSLEAQLNTSKDRISMLEQQCEQHKANVAQKDDELEQALGREAERNVEAVEMQRQIADLQQAVEARYEEGKKSAKTMETRKVQELVAERASAAQEYERRIKDMQRQLRHQSDKHNAQIQETIERNQKELEAMTDSLREEIRQEEGDKVNQLESELARLKRNFEGEKMTFVTKLQNAQTKSQDAAAEFDRQDEMKQEEIDRLYDQLKSYSADLANRESKISDLTKQLDDRCRTIQELGDIRKDDAIELSKREKMVEDERKKAEEIVSSLREEISSNKDSFRQLESSLRSEINSLREHAEEKERNLAESSELLRQGEETKNDLDKVRAELDAARDEFLTDRTNYENAESELRVELAKVQGKLRASESAIASKKARIEELETKLRNSTSPRSAFGARDELTSQVNELKRQLEDATNQAAEERAIAEVKEAEIIQLRTECNNLKDRLASVSNLEADAEELRSKLSSSQANFKRMEEELLQTKESYESSQSRLIEVEKDLTDLRTDFDRRLDDKQRTIMDLDNQKKRTDGDLSRLRKDYEDLSGLLEDSMHSSVNRDEADGHTRQLSEMESKMKNEIGWVNEELRSNIVQLQSTIRTMEEEKKQLTADLRNMERKYRDTKNEVVQTSRGGIEPELGRKDNHMREAVQRYMTTIADLESQLEESTHAKDDLEDRLASAKSELEEKQKLTEELVQRQTRATSKLEADLSKANSDLDHQSRELRMKSMELEQVVAKYSDENSEYRDMSQSAQDELRRKERQIDEMNTRLSRVNADLEMTTRECSELKAMSHRHEAELKQRKEQLNDVVARYTAEIADLQSKLDDYSVSQGKVENVQAEASRKDKKIKELLKSITDLETKLEVANRNRDSVKQNADLLSRDLEAKENDLRKLELEKIELETKLHTHSRSKDDLRAKITELSSRLERKEREVREVSDRYKVYVTELESKLDQDTDAKHHLQSEIDKLRTNLNSAEEVSKASELRKKISSLEQSVETYRMKANDTDARMKQKTQTLQEKLDEATKSKDDLEESLNKANSEKAEVIAALEGVINEVQNREDEIENLSDALQRREEELAHAKIIATKALQSAKDIQKRYKDKDQGLHSDMLGRMEEVSDNVDRLTVKNDELQRKISTLERDLRDKNLECKRLKDQLRQIDGKPIPKDEVSAVTTQSSYSAQTYSPTTSLRIETAGRQLEPTASIESASFSPTHSEFDDRGVSPGGGRPFMSQDDFQSIEKQYSGDFGAYPEERAVSDPGSGWIHDFGSGTSSFESSSSNVVDPPNGQKSRKSIERDALRKYVQQRFTQRN